MTTLMRGVMQVGTERSRVKNEIYILGRVRKVVNESTLNVGSFSCGH